LGLSGVVLFVHVCIIALNIQSVNQFGCCFSATDRRRLLGPQPPYRA
jgi:hypothetical protein